MKSTSIDDTTKLRVHCPESNYYHHREDSYSLSELLTAKGYNVSSQNEKATPSVQVSIVSDNALRPSDDLLDYLGMELNPDSERTIMNKSAATDSLISEDGDCNSSYGYDSFFYDSVTTFGTIPSPMTTPTTTSSKHAVVQTPSSSSSQDGEAVSSSCVSTRWSEISENEGADHQPVLIRPPAHSPLVTPESRKKLQQSSGVTPTSSNTSSSRRNNIGGSINKQYHTINKKSSPPWNKWVSEQPTTTVSSIRVSDRFQEDDEEEKGSLGVTVDPLEEDSTRLIVGRRLCNKKKNTKCISEQYSKDDLFSILEKSLSIAETTSDP